VGKGSNLLLNGETLMEPLIEQMKKVLADTFAFYLKAHYFHWNVQHSDFFMYHQFFETIYKEVYDAVDSIAEEIRALGGFAPGSFTRYMQLSSITDQTGLPSAEEMVSELYNDNNTVIGTLLETYKQAEHSNEIGLTNFLQDRFNAHKKHSWMLRSSMAKSK
jgi:starvation-inducible DNA-binding protein